MAYSIDSAAEFSVARGCGFAGLAIGVCMVGLITEPRIAFQCGGVLALITALIMMLRAIIAHRTPYNRTETWLLLPQADRPGPAIAQQVITSARRTAYLRFAQYWAAMAAGFLFVALLFRIAGA